jgi:aspartyl-tRNA(Asn)/glutamyl-tRNA(Gln) amidotransferase subunit C
MLMAKLTDKDIKHVAKLANLKLSVEDIKKYKKQLSEIVGYVDELSEVDTKGIIGTARTTTLNNVFKDDFVKDSLSQDDALSGKDDVYNSYFKVPAILSERSDK